MRKHRVAVPLLIAVAIVTGFLAVFATWANRQALNTDNWTNTSSALLADPKVQDALGAYLVSQLFTNIDVAAQLRSVLPQQAQGLAGPVAGGLRSLAEERVPKLLARPRVQAAWKQANRTAHKELLAVIDNKHSAVSTANGDVVLNTRPLIQQLADDVGIGAQVPNLPPQIGQLTIMHSDSLATTQSVAKGIKGLAIVLLGLCLLCFALAVWLAEGRRRAVLRTVGWSFFGIGVATLLVRRLAGNAVVDGLVKTDSVKDAAHDAFLIGSSLLYDIGIAMIIYGIGFVVAAWLAGPNTYAVKAREKLAPAFREHLGLTWGVVGLAYLVLLAWGPTPALRKLLGIVFIGALLALGVEVLRRQTAREFPAAGGALAGANDQPPDKDLAPSPS